MKNNMKSSTVKNIVVQCGPANAPFWTDEIRVDAEIFDDPLFEAATRAVEKRKNEIDFKVTITIETYETQNIKDPMQHFCYNTYFVFVNAGLHEKAELLRLNFKKLYGNDLQKESIRGEYEDGKSDTKSKSTPKSNSKSKPKINPKSDTGNSDKSYLN